MICIQEFGFKRKEKSWTKSYNEKRHNLHSSTAGIRVTNVRRMKLVGNVASMVKISDA